jgi:hypothetical protein
MIMSVLRAVGACVLMAAAANVAAAADKTPASRSGARFVPARSADQVTLTSGGSQEGHFCSSDGRISIIHNGRKDAYGQSSGFVTYLQSEDSGKEYRFNAGSWKILPGCYTHRIANATVVGTAQLTSSVYYSPQKGAAGASARNLGDCVSFVDGPDTYRNICGFSIVVEDKPNAVTFTLRPGENWPANANVATSNVLRRAP